MFVSVHLCVCMFVCAHIYVLFFTFIFSPSLVLMKDHVNNVDVNQWSSTITKLHPPEAPPPNDDTVRTVDSCCHVALKLSQQNVTERKH